MKIIFNDHIYLDLIKKEDASRLAEIANDEEISKNVGDTFPHPYTFENAERRINYSHDTRKSNDKKMYAVYIDNLYAGNLGWEIKLPDGRSKQNYRVGYRLGREYRGKGYMTKIFQVFTDYIFETEINCHRIYSAVYSRNMGSRRVMEKCGFVLEGTAKEAIVWDGVFYDEWTLSKIRQ